MDSLVESRRFAGKVGVVTGGASGIGAAVARRLVAEGASVAVGDVDEDGLGLLAAELGSSVVTVPTDVTCEVDVERLVAEAVERFGPLQVAVNAAGVTAVRPIVDTSSEEFERVLSVCLTGVFLSVKHEAARILEAGGGAIVNVASMNAEVPMAGGSAYGAAKAGVDQLSRCAALELAEGGIRVNCVSPGLIRTPMTATLFEAPARLKAFLDRIPAGEAGRPEDVAAAAAFLASNDARYVTGTNLVVDGGWSQSAHPNLLKLARQPVSTT